MPQVLNMRKLSRDQIKAMIASGKAVRCDRKTRFGNRFVMHDEEDRDLVCDQFEMHDLPTLDVTELRGKDLLCWCAPLRCHCNSILRKAND
jgi:hypothetical protein